ncbi:unnamed protein product [Urochloa humidicola]
MISISLPSPFLRHPADLPRLPPHRSASYLDAPPSRPHPRCPSTSPREQAAPFLASSGIPALGGGQAAPSPRAAGSAPHDQAKLLAQLEFLNEEGAQPELSPLSKILLCTPVQETVQD